MSSTCSCAFLLRLRCASAPSRLARAGSTTKRLESRAQDHREKEFLFKHSHVRVARCAGPHRRAPLSARARPQTCFNLIDIDGSGSITLAEFQKFGFIFNISTKVRTRARQCGRAWLTMRPCAGLPGSLPRVRRRQQQRAGLHRVPDVLPGAPRLRRSPARALFASCQAAAAGVPGQAALAGAEAGQGGWCEAQRRHAEGAGLLLMQAVNTENVRTHAGEVAATRR